MRMLVTGAAGFIGSHVCERLIGQGHEVIGLDSFVPYYPRPYKERNLARLRDEARFRFVEADLRDADLVPLVADADAIVHEAAMAGSASWEDFDLYVACNLAGTRRLLEAIRAAGEIERRRLLQVSTSSVYGVEACGDEDIPLRPANPYGITKLAAEQLATAYGASYGLPVVVVRYFSIYGPRQRPDMAYHKFIDALLHDRPITIEGDGEQTRGNTFIDDCVTGTLLALEKGHPGERYNIGGGVPISLNAAIATIEGIVGRRFERRQAPMRRGDQRHTLADIGKAQAHLGYAPLTTPEAGLRAQVAWQQSLLLAGVA
jgi:nucleoside-diphosphate-sugar epimerase